MAAGYSVDLVLDGKDQLGEVPLWCDRSQLLWWIDVRRPALQSLSLQDGQRNVYPLAGKFVGSWALCEDGRMLLAMEDGLHRFDPASKQQDLVLPLEQDKDGHRLNDGRVDRRGRFWVGTMHDTKREPLGSFYRIDADLTATAVMKGIDMPNSVAFSPDNRTAYLADSMARVIWAFDFDLDDGALTNRRVFRDLAGHPGIPDGSTVDADGCLWNAEYDGARLVRYTPRGEIDRVIGLPVTRPTSCCFAGPDFATLIVTTAAQKLSPVQLGAQPLAGGLFAVSTSTRGLPEARFAG